MSSRDPSQARKRCQRSSPCLNWCSASMRAAMALTAAPLRAGTGKCHPELTVATWTGSPEPGSHHLQVEALEADPLVEVNQRRHCCGDRPLECLSYGPDYRVHNCFRMIACDSTNN